MTLEIAKLVELEEKMNLEGERLQATVKGQQDIARKNAEKQARAERERGGGGGGGCVLGVPLY